MTTDGYERPSAKGDAPIAEPRFYFQGSRRMEGNAHGEACLPKMFLTHPALTDFVQRHSPQWDEIDCWKETPIGGGRVQRESLMVGGEPIASAEFAHASLAEIRLMLAGGGLSLDAALEGPRGNRQISDRPPAHQPSGSSGFDATVPVMPADTIYDEEGRLRPWIVVDYAGQPRTDVVYEQGVPYDSRGRRITVDEWNREVMA